jgi:SAM-dependent methyltransferase
MYYADKLETLKDIFGCEQVRLEQGRLVVAGRAYPVVNDVIILLDPSQYPAALQQQLALAESNPAMRPADFAEDIQFTFGQEWQKFPKVLPEHEQEFLQYFDLVDLSGLRNARVCDLGCGIGRWSYFLSDKCRELVLIDFSEAIFVAQRNLARATNALFFMGDLCRLPFRNRFADFLFCLGVLHHLPTPALDEVRALGRYAPQLLIYLYYALDNRPFYFRVLLALVTKLRLMAATIRYPAFRTMVTWFGALGIYLPLVLFGTALRPVGLSHHVPLYESYHGKSLKRIRQDVYDRFFTRIEQRVSKKQIMTLEDTFSKIIISNKLPYWHFVCKNETL